MEFIGIANPQLQTNTANYAAAALLMPYDRFLKACEDTRYDVDLLSHRFGTSFEQTAHRLTTLQKPDARGIPFFFLRIDAAGNVSDPATTDLTIDAVPDPVVAITLADGEQEGDLVLYDAAEFLDVESYEHVLRWVKEIDARPAVQRGRMVNRASGNPAFQLRERHDAGDFDTQTWDKIGPKDEES